MVQNNTCWKDTISSFMKEIKSLCTFEGKITMSTGRRTLIQQLRKQFHPGFHPWEMSELTGHGDVRLIEEYSHNPIETQRKMSHMMSKYSQSAQSQQATRTIRIHYR